MNSEIFVVLIRLAVFVALITALVRTNRHHIFSHERGYHFMLGGVCLLLFGAVAELLQNLPPINSAFDVGDINLLSIGQQYVGYTPGILLFLWGFIKLLPVFGDLSNTQFALAISEQKYRTLYESSPVMFLSLSCEGDVLDLNEHTEQTLGRSRDTLIGQHLSHLVDPKHITTAASFLEKCDQGQETINEIELPLKDENDENLWVKITAHQTTFDNHRQIQIFAQDITKSFRESEELRYQAHHDTVTGALNRVGIESHLRKLMDHSQGAHHVACMINLKRFRVVNDSAGHEAGDELLRQVALLIIKHLARDDLASRIGADDFFILFNHADKQQASERISAIIQDIDEFRFVWDHKTFDVGAHAGAVVIDEYLPDSIDVIRMADITTTVARNKAHEIYWYHQEDQETNRIEDSMSRIRDVRSALEDDRFELYAQPIVASDTLDNRLSHMEILIRMRSTEHVICPPNLFLPAAEQYNITHKIDAWVFDHVIEAMCNDPALFEPVNYLSLNLSGNTLSHEGVLNHIYGVLQSNPKLAKKIGFEITETAVVSNLVRAKRFINKVRSLGVRFALDDFGSGLSSFGYLKEFPVDYLKIDGQFVRDITNDPIDLSMVKAINEVAHLLGKQTIAEFVENDAVLAMLEQVGVDYYQGYHFDRPRPLLELLQSKGKSSDEAAAIA